MHTYQQPYPQLFMPLTIRGKTLRNRIVSSPQNGAPNLVRAGAPGVTSFTETAIKYFGAFARGGAAIVNTGHLGVDPEYYLGTDHEMFDFYTADATSTPILVTMADTIHAYGALASLELNHGGHQCDPVRRDYMIGPCDGECNGIPIKAMTEEEMNRVADCFANAAVLGKRCGFDVVNIHGGHNWLLGAFFSPITNQRTDEYGGSWENRARFPRMVLQRVRDRVGDKMIIEMRFSACEYSKGGISLDDAAATIDYLSDLVDIIQCSGGRLDDPYAESFSMSLPYMEHGCNAWSAAEMKKRLKSGIIVETVGGINEPALAEKIIAEGTADLVAMARSFTADPNWAEKARAGHAEDIRPCIRCRRCLAASTSEMCNRSKCAVNPRRILPVKLDPSELPFVKKNVAVIGGGAAGMMAAHELARKGHHVDLYEKSDRLGGILFFTDYVVFKDDLGRYRDYLITQVTKNPNISIHLNTQATPELMKALRPDAIVLAAGAAPFIPPVPGWDSQKVVHALHMFGHEDKLGDRVVVVGGGSVGCEATIHLQSLGKTVDILEMSDRLMPEEPPESGERLHTQFRMTHEFDRAAVPSADEPDIERVHIHLKAKCARITDEGVWIQTEDGSEQLIEADSVVMATGFRPDRALADSFRGLAPDYFVIGDCNQVGNITGTTEGGYYAALRI